MKLRNKSFILICALAISAFYSCKKSQDTVAPPTAPPSSSAETVKLTIHLGGDINVIETPMGRKKAGNENAAKDQYDSTIYAVDVRNGITPYAQGLFNQQGTITLEVPKNSTQTINVAVIKRGTGAGLFTAGMAGNQTYFYRPFNRRMIYEMEYANKAWGSPWELDTFFMSTMSQMIIRADPYSGDQEAYYYSETDSYFSSTTLTVGDTAVAVNIPVKRISFGIQYQINNFSEGALLAEYGGLMKPQYFYTWNDLSATMHIQTADMFRFGDDLNGETIPLTLKWLKPDGGVIPIGGISFTPKRNSLTTINVTLPLPTQTIVKPLIELSDTTFIGNEDVYF
jgi:hypothetical protein